MHFGFVRNIHWSSAETNEFQVDAVIAAAAPPTDSALLNAPKGIAHMRTQATTSQRQ